MRYSGFVWGRVVLVRDLFVLGVGSIFFYRGGWSSFRRTVG